MRKLRWYWYWTAPAVLYGVRVWREDGPWWAVAMVTSGLLLAGFGIWRHRKDPLDPPRFEVSDAWPELPVQPPSGTWQRRAHLLNATLAANLVLLIVTGFATGNDRSPSHHTWSNFVFWSLSGVLLLQALAYLAAWVRGQQLLRRELRLGYTT